MEGALKSVLPFGHGRGLKKCFAIRSEWKGPSYFWIQPTYDDMVPVLGRRNDSFQQTIRRFG